jgi:hypothetical protein|tara:strand:+ start:36 stop:563 length:528 start_codon:yes stop_codon:yes gene_type:complete
MKKLLTILLTILTFCSYGQQRIVEAEKIIFRMVNEYRVSQGLESVVWSEKVYDAAYHHSSYMSNKGVPYAHTETVDVDGHEEINDPQMRISKYCGSSSWGTECLAGLRLMSWTSEPWDLEKACRTVVNDWINSPGHKKAMLYDKEGNGNLTIGAVSAIKVSYCETAIPVLVLVNK